MSIDDITLPTRLALIARNMLPLTKEELEQRYCTASSTKIMITVEPITWAWIAMKLAEGAIAWLGAKVLESMFGDFTKANIRLQDIIRAELQGEALRKASAFMESISVRIEQYHNAGGLDRLEFACKDAADLTAEFKSLNTLGFHNYHIAVSLEILILQDRMKATKNKKEKKNIQGAIERALEHVYYLHPYLIEAAGARVGPVYTRAFFPALYGCFTVDGRETCPCQTDTSHPIDLEACARPYRQSTVDGLKQEVQQQQIVPSIEIANKWKNLKDSL